MSGAFFSQDTAFHKKKKKKKKKYCKFAVKVIMWAGNSKRER